MGVCVLLLEMRLGGRRNEEGEEAKVTANSPVIPFCFIFVLLQFLQADLQALSLPPHAIPLKLPK